jgi:hypothetical protein
MVRTPITKPATDSKQPCITINGGAVFATNAVYKKTRPVRRPLMDEPLVPLWSQFRSYLKVRLEVHHAGGVSKNAVLEVIVENSAPSSESFPNVTFESVEAVVNIGLHAETVARSVQ